MKSIGTLAGCISRDFNKILTYIIGYTELAPAALKNSTLPDVCFSNPYLKHPAISFDALAIWHSSPEKELLWEKK